MLNYRMGKSEMEDYVKNLKKINHMHGGGISGVYIGDKFIPIKETLKNRVKKNR